MSRDPVDTDTDSVFEEPVPDQANDSTADPDADPEMLDAGKRGHQQDQAEGDDDPTQTGADA